MYEGKTILWNVDPTFDFMRSDEDHQGTLYVPGAETIEPNMLRLKEVGKEKGLQMILTGDDHLDNAAEFAPPGEEPNYDTTWPKHSVRGTKGASFVPAAALENPTYVHWDRGQPDLAGIKDAQEIVLYKDHVDVFVGNPYTDQVVDAINPDNVIVYGVAGDVCVSLAIQGFLKREKNVIVATDAIKNLPGTELDDLISDWKGAKLQTVDEIVEALTPQKQYCS